VPAWSTGSGIRGQGQCLHGEQVVDPGHAAELQGVWCWAGECASWCAVRRHPTLLKASIKPLLLQRCSEYPKLLVQEGVQPGALLVQRVPQAASSPLTLTGKWIRMLRASSTYRGCKRSCTCWAGRTWASPTEVSNRGEYRPGCAPLCAMHPPTGASHKAGHRLKCAPRSAMYPSMWMRPLARNKVHQTEPSTSPAARRAALYTPTQAPVLLQPTDGKAQVYPELIRCVACACGRVFPAGYRRQLAVGIKKLLGLHARQVERYQVQGGRFKWQWGVPRSRVGAS